MRLERAKSLLDGYIDTHRTTPGMANGIHRLGATRFGTTASMYPPGVAQPPSLVDLAQELHEVHTAAATAPLPWHLDGWCAVAHVQLDAAGGFTALFRGLANALIAAGARQTREPRPRQTVGELARSMHAALGGVTPTPWEEAPWLSLARGVLESAENTEVMAEHLLGKVLPGGGRQLH